MLSREQISAVRAALEYVYIKMGRRRWYVSKELLAAVGEIKTDVDNWGDVVLPYDSMAICFERGTEVLGVPLRWVRFGMLQSKTAQALIAKDIRGVRMLQNCLRLDIDVGEEAETHEFSPDTPMDKTVLWHQHANWNTDPELHKNVMVLMEKDGTRREVPYAGTGEHNGALGVFKTYDFKPDEEKTVSEIVRLVKSLVLFHAARPEWFVTYTLPRTDRYSAYGDRENSALVTFPVWKKIVTGTHAANGEPTRTNAPHYRGWVLRTLRAARYTRNSDGSCKVVLVAPTAIHPELMTKE
jgi:hypothetical protein